MQAKTYANVLQILILIYSSRQEKLPGLSEKRAPEPVSQRIWTPPWIWTPSPADLDPGPDPLADLDPPVQIR